MANWIAAAREKMEKKGTVGAFGRATGKKISRAKKQGGLQKKRAVFAENMKKIAGNRSGRSEPNIQNKKPAYIG